MTLSPFLTPKELQGIQGARRCSPLYSQVDLTSGPKAAREPWEGKRQASPHRAPSCKNGHT